MKNVKTQILLPTICCILWATTFASSKIALEFMPKYMLAATRFFSAGVLALIITIIVQIISKKKSALPFIFSELKKYWKSLVIIGFLQIGLNYTLFYTGINLVPPSAASVIIGSSPFVVAVVTHIFLNNDKLTGKKIFCIFTGIAGITFLNLGKGFSGAFGAKEFIGMFLLFLSLIVSAFAGIYIKKTKIAVNSLILNSGQLIFGSFWLFLLSFVNKEAFEFPNQPSFYIAWSSLVVVSAVAFSIWYFIMQKPEVKLSEINIFKFIIPVIGSILSWALVSTDTPDIWTVAGICLVGFGVIFYYWTPRFRK